MGEAQTFVDEMAQGTRQSLHLVASSGGHLELIVELLPALAGYERIWVTAESDRARDIATSGDRVELVSFYGRNPFKLLRHLRQVLPLISKERPQAVITTGAGTAIPFCVSAWLLGAKIIFVETMARVTNASISGRILSRLSSVTVVQWPEMLDVYRCARLCSPALLSDIREKTTSEDSCGTFVAVGTHFQSFDRLLSTVDRAVGSGLLPAPATGQAGASRRHFPNLSLVEFMSPEHINEAMARSRYVICHAGSGVISAALRAGRRPLVMPRLQAHGEHVDDHQTQIVKKLEAMSLIVPITDEITAADLAAADTPPAEHRVVDGLPNIEDALSQALQAVLGVDANALAMQRDGRQNRPSHRTNQATRTAHA